MRFWSSSHGVRFIMLAASLPVAWVATLLGVDTPEDWQVLSVGSLTAVGGVLWVWLVVRGRRFRRAGPGHDRQRV